MVLYRPTRSLRSALHYWWPRRLTIKREPDVNITAWLWWNYEVRKPKARSFIYLACAIIALTESYFETNTDTAYVWFLVAAWIVTTIYWSEKAK